MDTILPRSCLVTHIPSSAAPPRAGVGAEVINGVAAKRAGVLVAALEPLVKAGTVELVAAGAATLIRHALVATHDTVANGALRLPLHCPKRVTPERRQTVDDAPALLHWLSAHYSLSSILTEQSEGWTGRGGWC